MPKFLSNLLVMLLAPVAGAVIGIAYGNIKWPGPLAIPLGAGIGLGAGTVAIIVQRRGTMLPMVWLTVIVGGLVGFGVGAWLAQALELGETELGETLVDAVQGGGLVLGCALAIILLVLGSRRPGTLYCPSCGSDRVIEVGAGSSLDGKRDHLCQDCQFAMGPLRSRVVALVLTVMAGSFGLIMAVIVVLKILKGEDRPKGPVAAFVAMCAAFVLVGYRELRKSRPLLRSPRSIPLVSGVPASVASTPILDLAGASLGADEAPWDPAGERLHAHFSPVRGLFLVVMGLLMLFPIVLIAFWGKSQSVWESLAGAAVATAIIGPFAGWSMYFGFRAFSRAAQITLCDQGIKGPLLAARILWSEMYQAELEKWNKYSKLSLSLRNGKTFVVRDLETLSPSLEELCTTINGRLETGRLIIGDETGGQGASFGRGWECSRCGTPNASATRTCRKCGLQI